MGHASLVMLLFQAWSALPLAGVFICLNAFFMTNSSGSNQQQLLLTTFCSGDCCVFVGEHWSYMDKNWTSELITRKMCAN